MKIHPLVAGAIISAVLGLEVWTLTAVVDLKVQVAEIRTQLAALNAANHQQNQNIAYEKIR